MEDYILDKDLTPRIDKTNYRPIYTRNKIRLNLIPRIDEEFGRDVSEALLRLGNLARIDGAYMNRVAMDALEEAKQSKGGRPPAHSTARATAASTSPRS